jgi:hypothetical protein
MFDRTFWLNVLFVFLVPVVLSLLPNTQLAYWLFYIYFVAYSCFEWGLDTVYYNPRDIKLSTFLFTLGYNFLILHLFAYFMSILAYRVNVFVLLLAMVSYLDIASIIERMIDAKIYGGKK